MPLSSKTLFRLLLLLFLLSWSALAPAQETRNPTPDTATVTTQELMDLRAALHAGRDRLTTMLEAIDTGPAQAWLEGSPSERLTERVQATADSDAENALWRTALEYERAGTERLRAALERARRALEAEQRLDAAERRLAEPLEARVTRSPPEDRPVSRIDEAIAELERRRTRILLEQEQKRQLLASLEAEAEAPPETLEPLLGEETDETAAELPDQPEDESLAEALAAREQARLRHTDARILAAQLDNATLLPRMELLRLELQVLDIEQRWLNQRLAQLTRELSERTDAALRTLRDDLRRLTERTPDAADRFEPEIQSLLRRIDQVAEIQERIRILQAQRERYTRIESDLSQTLASVRERLEIGGLTDVLGGLLMDEQRRLRDLLDLGLVQNDLERELSRSRLRDITLREELRDLPSVSSEIGEDSAAAKIRRLQRELITMQLQAEEMLTDQLRQTELRLRAAVLQVEELSQLLRESLLWWPSHPPVGTEWSARVPDALEALTDPVYREEIRSALTQVTVGRPGGSALTLLLAGVLLLSARHTRRQLARLAELTSHRFTDRIGLTFQALGWSLLRALPIPLVLASTGLRLQQLPDIGPGIEILATVMFSTALWWLVGHLALLFTAKNGVGTAHLEWNPRVVARLRRNLAWYLPIQLLLIALVALAVGHPEEPVADVLGRAGLLASVVVAAVLAWRMLAPWGDAEAATHQQRRRRLTRVALMGYALFLAGLTLGGYLITVATLLAHTINTAVLVAGVWLGYSVTARYVALCETRLLIQRMREQRANASAPGGPVGTAAATIDTAPEPYLSVENINQQTHTLLRVMAGVAIVLGLFWVWSDVLPALTWLDRVTLWSRTIAVGETEILTRVSLQDLLLAVFLGVLFTLAARNLPGLVEILLARSTRMDAAGRYTATTLLRYGLAVVAVISVFSLLGLRWSELQWMVAALTLGLGFGLQEVVANFVSGLIMLFERPVRVGDTISIGEYSGTVTRIRTRATTIMDWDNREIVVPNKNFITERLINWTLSDTTTRIVLPVGVSYDADIDEVMETLDSIAHNHPLVLKDPEPTVLFLKFGESALSFELRVYVSQVDERLGTISELHQAIIREFRRRGIRIAYPQMDLHIRDMPPIAEPGGRGERMQDQPDTPPPG